MSSSGAAFSGTIGPLSSGYLLGGRVRYAQPGVGFRTGIEPVLLASAVPVCPGERVLDGGTGAGPALLCLAARVSQSCGVGIEQDVGLAELARQNLAANGLSERFAIITGDLTACDDDLGLFAHACANPPWHDPEDTASPIPRRLSAKRADPKSLEAWAVSLVRRLRRGGTLTMILPAALAPTGCRAIEAAGCGSLVLVPLWPKSGQAARLILVQALKSAAGECRLLPGLTLHRDQGGYSEVVQALLCCGAAAAL
jgi:tRNA1Val (adenine37-N6)-methyltransferase